MTDYTAEEQAAIDNLVTYAHSEYAAGREPLDDGPGSIKQAWVSDRVKQGVVEKLQSQSGVLNPQTTPTAPSAAPTGPEKPKLSKTGQALQSGLDLISRGGDRGEIQSKLNQQVAQARQSGDETTANALASLAGDYARSTSEAASVSTTEGWAAIGNIQRDIAAGKYNEGSTTKPLLPFGQTTEQGVEGLGAYQARLDHAMASGNNQSIAVAQRDLNAARAARGLGPSPAVYQGWGIKYAGPDADINNAIEVLPDGTEGVTYLRALRGELEALNDATVTVQTTTADDELLRRYRANA